jgi:hypothetical protein
MVARQCENRISRTASSLPDCRLAWRPAGTAWQAFGASLSSLDAAFTLTQPIWRASAAPVCPGGRTNVGRGCMESFVGKPARHPVARVHTMQ